MVSNRGHDSIAVFAIEGERRAAGHFPHAWAGAARFLPLKDGRILIAHQNGDVTLARLAEDGFVPPFKGTLDVRGAVCVLPFEEENGWRILDVRKAGAGHCARHGGRKNRAFCSAKAWRAS